MVKIGLFDGMIFWLILACFGSSLFIFSHFLHKRFAQVKYL